MVLPRIVEPVLMDGLDPNSTSFHSGAVSSSFVVASAAARLFVMRAIVDTGVNADRIVMAFDLIAVPADGTAPIWEMFLPRSNRFVEAGDDFDPVKGLAFGTGIVLVSSTTTGVLTISPADVVFFGAFVG